MNNNKKTSKTRKIIYITLGVLIFLIIAVIGLNMYVEKLVRSEVMSQINQNPESLYKIDFEDIDIGILRGNVIIKKIEVNPRESAIEKLDKGEIKTLVSSHIDLFQIKRLKILKFISNKNIIINQIKIENAEVNYLINPGQEQHKMNNTLILHNIFSDKFNGADIRDLEIRNATLKFLSNKNPDEPLFEADSVSVAFKDIVMNEETLKKPIPFSFSDFTFDTKHSSIKALEYYDIYTSNVNFNIDDTCLVINNFRIEPKYSKEEYNKLIKFENDWFSISTDKIVLYGLNLRELEFNDIFRINTIDIINPDIKIYRDKRLPDPPFKYKPLIASIIKKISYTISVDTVLIKNGKLVYQEMHDLTNEPGEVDFDALYISVYNVTNDSQQIKKNPVLQVSLSSFLMDEGNLKTDLRFYLNSPRDYFTAKGKLDSISGFAFNKITKNLLLVQINMGEIYSAEFEFTANDDVSNGKMIIFYDNLKVEIFKPKHYNKKSKAWSFIANKLIKKKNLPDDPKFRTGTIYFERIKNKALPNYLWNSLKTGIISTIAPIAEKKQHKKKQKK